MTRVNYTQLRPEVENLTASVDLAAKAVEDEDGRRRFSMVGYTGSTVSRLYGDAVFELAGIEHGEQVPILFNHDETQIAGYADSVELTERGLELSGYLSSVTDAGRQVAALSDEGLRWQASVGLQVSEWEEVGAKASAEVNGTQLSGPLSVGRRSRLLEVSFVTAGADRHTSAVALTAKEQAMEASVTREELAEFLAEFPDRKGWAAEQFAAGKTMDEARAALAVEIAAELASERIARAEAEAARDEALSKLAVLEQLEADARHPGVGFDGSRDQLAAQPAAPNTPDEAWDSDETLRARFFNTKSVFLAYVGKHGLQSALED